jgi:hypothetical protein
MDCKECGAFTVFAIAGGTAATVGNAVPTIDDD